MKKNKVVFAAIVAALSVTCYSAYQIYSVNKRAYSPQILENVEALTAEIESSNRNKPVTRKCHIYPYMNYVDCEQGGNQICVPSECR